MGLESFRDNQRKSAGNLSCILPGLNNPADHCRACDEMIPVWELIYLESGDNTTVNPVGPKTTLVLKMKINGR